MQKYFPLFALIISFGVYRFSQVYGNAGEKSRLHYQTVFENATFTSTSGQKYLGRELKDVIVVLNFWASWCAPCLEEFPSLIVMKEKFRDDQVIVLGINADEEKQLEKMAKIKRKYKLDFPLVADSTGSHVQNFMVSELPTTLIFFKGKMVKMTRGGQDFDSDESIEFFNRLLKRENLL